jgi:hypothetical protein
MDWAGSHDSQFKTGFKNSGKDIGKPSFFHLSSPVIRSLAQTYSLTQGK